MNKIQVIENAVKTFQYLADNYDNTNLQKAHLKVANEILCNTKLPILSNDEEVKKYIKEFQLDNPKNMINFFVEASFSAVEEIIGSAEDLKLLDMIIDNMPKERRRLVA